MTSKLPSSRVQTVSKLGRTTGSSVAMPTRAKVNNLMDEKKYQPVLLDGDTDNFK